MDKSDNLNLPYILPSQAQKHVTHNEAIKAIDAIAQLAVTSRSIQTPPTTPTAGVRYIVPTTGATATWSGRAKQIAAWQDGDKKNLSKQANFFVSANGFCGHVLTCLMETCNDESICHGGDAGFRTRDRQDAC